ncbi:MAG: hypothetical protein ABR906_11355 [Terracidiphilus sp.]|jgi:hypothetical protein
MKRIVIILALLVGGSGYAVASKSYVDPSYGKVQYSDIVKPAQPYRVRLVVEFQRNGQHLPAVDGELMKQVNRVIQASGFAIQVSGGDTSMDELDITVNNVADLGEARRKGFETGATFFLKGSTVTDYYEMSATAKIAGQTITKTGYKHAIHTTVGLARGPKDLPSMTVDEAFSKVVEQLVLNFLGDLQKEQLQGQGSTVLPAGVAPVVPTP